MLKLPERWFKDSFTDNKSPLPCWGFVPESVEPTAQEYQRLLWGRELPVGDRVLSVKSGVSHHYQDLKNAVNSDPVEPVHSRSHRTRSAAIAQIFGLSKSGTPFFSYRGSCNLSHQFSVQSMECAGSKQIYGERLDLFAGDCACKWRSRYRGSRKAAVWTLWNPARFLVARTKRSLVGDQLDYRRAANDTRNSRSHRAICDSVSCKGCYAARRR